MFRSSILQMRSSSSVGVFLAAGILAGGLLIATAHGVPASRDESALTYLSGAGAGSDAEPDLRRFFIEVPPEQRALVIELFDADVLMAAGDAEEVDRARGGIGDTKVRYELYDPSGQRAATRWVTADENAPAGADRAWLTFFSSRTSGIVVVGRFADSFDRASYDNDDGNRRFAGPWQGSSDLGGGGVTGGDIRIDNGALVISNQYDVEPWSNQPNLERELDLSSFSAAVLAFDFATGAGVDFEDTFLIEVSADGGGAYHVLEELIGIVGASSGQRAYDISTYLGPRTRIRFRVGRFHAGPEEGLRIDNLEVRAAAEGGSSPSPGKWQLVVDMSANLNREITTTFGESGWSIDENGNDVNGFGLRAHDGDPGPTGKVFNVYSDSTRSAEIQEMVPDQEPTNAEITDEVEETEPVPAPPPPPELLAPPPVVTETVAPPTVESIIEDPSLDTAVATPVPPVDYRVGSGDTLKIEVFEDTRLGGEFTVSTDGVLIFPLLGEVEVAEKTASEIQKLLVELLEKDYLYNPHVSVTVTAFRSQKVQIQGMVRMPGIYYLEGPTRIFDLLSRAQGLLQAPGEIRAGQVARIVRSETGETFNVDLHELLVLGNDTLNIPLQDGDVVYVLRTEEVHVIGEVKRPGSFPYEEGMTVLKALSLAGGATKRGSVKGVVVRRIQDGEEVQIKMSVEDLLLPDDILEVPLSFW